MKIDTTEDNISGFDSPTSFLSSSLTSSPVSPLSPSGRRIGASTVASRMRYSDPGETLIFFDWDDTLFPSTEIFDRWGFPSCHDSWKDITYTVDQRLELESWKNAVFNYLNVALSLSEQVAIVTNSKRPWVTDCARHFAPKLLELMERHPERLIIVYAPEVAEKSIRRRIRPIKYGMRENMTQREIDDHLTSAKLFGMKRVAERFYSRYPNQSWKNIVSIGDMHYEHHALQELTFQRVSPLREQLRTKIITMPAASSISRMAVMITMWRVLLPAVVFSNGDFDIGSGRSSNERLEEVAEALHLPELLSLCWSTYDDADFGTKVPLPEQDEVAALVDEVTLIVQDALVG